MTMVNQAIQTKFHGPTNTRGSHIGARCAAMRISVPYNHGLDTTGNHRAAALALAARLNWGGSWTTGVLADGSYVHVTNGERA